MRKRRRKRQNLLILQAAFLAVFLVAFTYSKLSDISEPGNRKSIKTVEYETESTSVNNNNTNSRYLLLVNKDNKLPDDYDVDLKTLNNGRSQVDETIYSSLRDMLTDGSDQGLNFCVASAYRSRERQQEILDNDIDMYMSHGMDYEDAREEALKQVMPPGFSEHETGLALDIVSLDYQLLDENQEDTAENIWLRENCHKYGFILRYPKGKEDITGCSPESWHFRYVGREAAEYIMENGITLEEYIKCLK
ncbi:D-alanyl-D-alanine carboxypeptidase [Clostridiales bacterium]|nr:D-alanyl-D-alanine carboxypeptidase [Clostridiales bacterium]